MSPTKPRFKLPDDFVAEYADLQPDWGPLGWVTYKRTYARWADRAQTRREEWFETVRRVVEGNINLDPRERTPEVVAELEAEAKEMFDTIFHLAWTPPGRGLWISGTPYSFKNGDAMVNCWNIDVKPGVYEGEEKPKASFPFVMALDLLAKGGGVGFNATRENILQFPPVQNPLTVHIVCDPHHPNIHEVEAGPIPQTTHTMIRIEDSREGWYNALRVVIDGHFKKTRERHVVFDVSDIRPFGTPIHGFGGTASGPGPLVKMLRDVNNLLNDCVGTQLSTVEAVDIMNMVGRCVVAGNVRRSAELALGSSDDLAFIAMKQNKDKLMSHRWASNNSIAIDSSFTDFERIAQGIVMNGEPGIVNLELARTRLRLCDETSDERNLDVSGTNPCLTGDTLVALADGRGHLSIRQLAEEGQDVPVYCLDSGGAIAVRMMRNPRLTGRGLPVYRITLDDGSYIDATGNHKFLLRDGSYREVVGLQPSDSLIICEKTATDGESWLSVAGGEPHSERDLWAREAEFLLELDGAAVERICEICGMRFELPYHRREISYCSAACASSACNDAVKAVEVFANHTVTSVELLGAADVYNGTVDEFHNFFVGGFASETRDGKPKLTYINNRNCGEIVLGDGESCNLAEIYPAIVERKGFDMERILRMALRYTKRVTCANYSWPTSKAIVTRNRRVGVSLSGIRDWMVAHDARDLTDKADVLDGWYKIVRDEDRKFSEKLGLPESVAVTTVKPSGTVSLLNGSSPGLHAHWSPYMIRRVRFQSADPLVDLLRDCGFYIEPDAYSPNTVVAEFPIKAPNADKPGFVSAGDLTLEEQFETQAALQRWWSDNSVSATLTFKKSEQKKIASLLRQFRDQIKSTSLLPYQDPTEDHTYVQPPYEAITRERYEEMTAKIQSWPHEMAARLHEEKKHEYELLSQEDCAGGACPIK